MSSKSLPECPPARSEEDGFTLVEILVVIIIIGILAAVAIPIFLNQQRSARDSATQQDVRNLATNIETALVSNPEAEGVWLYEDEAGEVGDHYPGNLVPASATSFFVAVNTDGDDYDLTHASTPIKVSKTEGTQLWTRVDSSTPGAYRVGGWNENGLEWTDGESEEAVYYLSNKGGIEG